MRGRLVSDEGRNRVMNRATGAVLALLWLFAVKDAAGVMLGDIEVHSVRNQPFDARIALAALPEGGVGALQVGLAGVEHFAAADLERPVHLSSLRFEVVAHGDGSAHIRVTGRDPVTSPFVDFLVETVWPGGRVIREYMVLLDLIDLPSSSVDLPSPEAAGTYGPVRAIDTLWSIAERTRPAGVSVHRMMLALLAANPRAFLIDNVNALRAGTVLDLPDRARIGPDDSLAAVEEVRRQNATWQAYRESGAADAAAASPAPLPATAPEVAGGTAPAPEDAGGGVGPEAAAEDAAASAAGDDGRPGGAPEAELRVISAGTGEGARPGDEQALRDELDLALEEADSRRQEVEELSARLDEAERLVSDLQRLVALKDDDIASLQRRVAAQAQAEAAALAAAAQARARAEEPAEVTTPAEAPTEEEEAQAETGPAPAEAEALAASGGEVPVGAEAAQSEEGPREKTEPEGTPLPLPPLLERVEALLGFSPVVGGVGLVGVILILGGLIALMRRRRRPGGTQYSEGEADAASGSRHDEPALEGRRRGVRGRRLSREVGGAGPGAAGRRRFRHRHRPGRRQRTGIRGRGRARSRLRSSRLGAGRGPRRRRGSRQPASAAPSDPRPRARGGAGARSRRRTGGAAAPIPRCGRHGGRSCGGRGLRRRRQHRARCRWGRVRRFRRGTDQARPGAGLYRHARCRGRPRPHPPGPRRGQSRSAGGRPAPGSQSLLTRPRRSPGAVPAGGRGCVR